MKIVLGLTFLLSSFTASAGFIHPMDFDNSESQQKEVIDHIKGKVKADYCEGAIDMCQESMLRMMEKQNLSAFKKLTQATNRKILDQVISDYCRSDINMCNYDIINMMYNQNLKASHEELSW